MYQKVYLHEHISKAISECEDEIERRTYWVKNKDYYCEKEKQVICDDLKKFKSIKRKLEKLYEEAKTFETY